MTYTFANAAFDPTAGLLTVSGRSVTLRPRTGAVLRYLLDRPGEVVAKDDLLREIWSDLVVTENSLAQCVKEIRRELGDAQETLVRTVHRRGYVLESRVERSPAARLGTEAIGVRGMSLIVLPLANLGGDPDQDYFAEGLTDDFTMDIGRTQDLVVIAPGTAQGYAGRRVDPRDLQRELGVQYVVEGSVRRDESRIVVNLSVSDARDARLVWAERFEAVRENLHALQRSMAARLACMLQLELANAESRRLEGRDPATLNAEDLATRAFSLWHRQAPNPTGEPRRLVERALDIDPRCSRAWAMLGRINLMALATRTARDWNATVHEAEQAVRKALEIDPDDRNANGALGAALAYQGRLEEALGALERQMAVNPNEARAQQWLGIVHILMGNAGLAIAPLERCIELSPRDPRISTYIRNLALAHLHLKRDEEGLFHAERSVHVPDVWPRSYETLAMAYAVNGLMDDARPTVDVLVKHWPGYTIAQHRAEMMSERPAFVAQRERLLEGLARAGLPAK